MIVHTNDPLCIGTTENAGSPYDTIAADTEDPDTEDPEMEGPHPKIPTTTASKSTSKRGQYESMVMHILYPCLFFCGDLH